MNCIIQNCVVEGDACIYEVMEETINNHRRCESIFKVNYNRNTNDFNCKCLLFEFRGIICRHSLVVLAQERQQCVLPKYVLQRWSKTVRRRHSYIRSSLNAKEKLPHIERFDALCERFSQIAEIACEKDQTTDLLFRQLEAFAKRHCISVQPIRQHCSASYAATNTVHNDDYSNDNLNQNIHSPVAVRRKGRPCSKRLEGVSEKPKKRKKATNVKVTTVTQNSVRITVPHHGLK